MEIERKWLVSLSKIPYDLSKYEHHALKQAYVSFSPTIRIREFDGGKQYILTVKSHPDGLKHASLQREEYEIPISKSEYESLLKKVSGNIVSKTRYIIPVDGGLVQELDVFDGYLEGLCLMEIEFPNVESALSFESPYWVDKDVTDKHKYKNSALSQIDSIKDIS